MEILRELRDGAIDVLVGVNLLREGLDLPEVVLAIMDADKEGFLRSNRSLTQPRAVPREMSTAGSLYADKVTDSMAQTIEETRAGGPNKWRTPRNMVWCPSRSKGKAHVV